jgi:hypothetical protein
MFTPNMPIPIFLARAITNNILIKIPTARAINKQIAVAIGPVESLAILTNSPNSENMLVTELHTPETALVPITASPNK